MAGRVAQRGEEGAEGCLFCGIVAGTTPAHVVHRDDEVVAFLDIAPLFEGHTLVVPTRHLPTLADLPAQDSGGFLQAVQRTAAALGVALGCEGTFVAMNNVVSQSVPHLHAHVVPRTKGDGLRGFFWPRTRYSDDDAAAAVAARIARAFADDRR